MPMHAASARIADEPWPVPETPAVEPGQVHFGFLLLPNFSMIAFSGAVEVLRMANYVSRRELYRWSVMTLDGAAVHASNRLPIRPLPSRGLVDDWDALFVCGGLQVQDQVTEPVIKLLHNVAREGVALGGICTGSYALVKAGLMAGYRCAMHWENLFAVHEEFPAVELTEELFVIDRDRMTSSGGTAPIDLMLGITAERFGAELAHGVSEQFMLERIRLPSERQHIPMVARVGYNRQELLNVAQLMEAHIEDPLSFRQIAVQIGLSQRQLQRMFKYYLGMSPMRYYLWLRLLRARELLLQTHMTIMGVTVACGFQSPCHFSKAYRARFGRSPSSERRQVPD
ncbi:GlxA family transcriptional regulator [Achromobacter sp. ESBL13]|uniref:GlxA family transcriptional regulator n=1 Tax=Achromobacter sp. ESBL13 TaxID=3077328 RepID=UPI002FC7A000